jgi:transposase
LVSAGLQEAMETLQRAVLALDKEIIAVTLAVSKTSEEQRPKGCGKLSTQLLDREIMDWHRFKNRRAVGSFAGLCPGVAQSDGTLRMKSITKAGNRRVRRLLIEMAWLMKRHQPEYHALRKWRAALAGGSCAQRKKAIVAVARQLMIDLWRVKTRRATYEQLGLVMNEA